MISEYNKFISRKTDYWRKAKQYEYQDIDRMVLALQNINHFTTRNTMTLRILGLVKNLGGDQLEITEVGKKFLQSSEKQKIIDEQLLKIFLDSTINSGLSIPVFPLQITYLMLNELEYITFEEYLLFVCWITDKSEVSTAIRLILDYRGAPDGDRQHINKIFKEKQTELGTQDIEDNVKRLFNMFPLSSFIDSEGSGIERVLFRNSSPKIYEKLANILDEIKFDDYIEFDYEHQGLITFGAEHQGITQSLQSLTIEERKLLHRDITESKELPDLEKVKPIKVTPSITTPETSAVPNKKVPGMKRKVKPDYVARESRNRIVGLHAEKVVFKLEFDKLMAAGKPVLARQVAQVSEEDDSLGYDILSFTPHGTEKHIEVKAVDGYPSIFRFFISSNELLKAKTDPSFCLYVVFDYKTEEPKIWEFPNVFKTPDPRIKIECVKFAVTVKIKK